MIQSSPFGLETIFNSDLGNISINESMSIGKRYGQTKSGYSELLRGSNCQSTKKSSTNYFDFHVKEQIAGTTNNPKHKPNDTIQSILSLIQPFRRSHYDLLSVQSHYNFTIMILFKHPKAPHFMPSLNPTVNTIPSEETYSQLQENLAHRLPKEKLQLPSHQSPQMKGQKGLSKGKKNGFSVSLWKLQENIDYMNFLKANEPLFSASKIQKKQMKINIMMSEHVKSRSPAQCRSHHQKMVKHHGLIFNIVSHIERLMTRTLSKHQESPTLPYQQLSHEKPIDLPQPDIQEWQDSKSAIFDWCSWMHQNQLIWEQKMNEEWMGVVGDIFGDL